MVLEAEGGKRWGKEKGGSREGGGCTWSYSSVRNARSEVEHFQVVVRRLFGVLVAWAEGLILPSQI